jgi:hypothetical protein
MVLFLLVSLSSREVSNAGDHFMLVEIFVIQSCPTYATDSIDSQMDNPPGAGAAP